MRLGLGQLEGAVGLLGALALDVNVNVLAVVHLDVDVHAAAAAFLLGLVRLGRLRNCRERRKADVVGVLGTCVGLLLAQLGLLGVDAVLLHLQPMAELALFLSNLLLAATYLALPLADLRLLCANLLLVLADVLLLLGNTGLAPSQVVIGNLLLCDRAPRLLHFLLLLLQPVFCVLHRCHCLVQDAHHSGSLPLVLASGHVANHHRLPFWLLLSVVARDIANNNRTPGLGRLV
mmetsp:Transcript_9415/g.21503  ORF Transcript_9415/g.21503 Transcript_9415/m.21503 type:complete len:233 (+) Transcript_9415:158-856(+)